MDQNLCSFCETCTCGRAFYFPGALKNHERSCSKRKKRLSGALEKARVLWTSRKKARLDLHTNGSQQMELERSDADDIGAEVSVSP